MSPPIISIVGKKKCGKTTFIERLIPELKRKRYRIGTVKHDTHGFNIDHEGKDSWRHKNAGAETVAIASPSKISLIKDVAKEPSLDEIVETFFGDMDLVITEGYKRANKFQIEIFRSTAHEAPLDRGAGENLVAMVTDCPLDLEVPRFGLDDIRGVAELIEAKWLKKS